MKILFEALGYGEGDNLGGSVRVAALNARAMAARGHEVTFLCTNLKDNNKKLFKGFHRVRHEGVNIFYLDTRTLPYWPGTLGPHYVRVPLEIKRMIEDADVVHLNDYRSFLSGRVGLHAISHGVPFIMQPMGTFLHHKSSGLIKRIYDCIWANKIRFKASKFLAATKNEAMVLKDNGIESKRISILPNGIDIKGICPMPAKGHFRKRLGISRDIPICVSVGRLDRIKGYDLMIRALIHLPPRVKYVIVGPDQGLGESLKCLARNLGLSERVILTGCLPSARDVWAAMIDADIIVVPSRFECFGQVILEAALVGRPLVLTSGCNITTHLNKSMALVAEPQPMSLAEACAKFFADPKLQKKYAEKARRVVKSEYDINVVAEKLEAIYSRICRNKTDYKTSIVKFQRARLANAKNMHNHFDHLSSD